MLLKNITYTLLTVLFLSAFFVHASPVEAASPITALKGWAWSDNIGWISMNCLDGGKTRNDVCASNNYGISVQADGALTGYAWSDNIGWIEFGGLSGFPIGAGTVAKNAHLTSTNTLTGWVRACAGLDEPGNSDQSHTNNTCADHSRTDGWDGWISLSGTGYGVSLQNNDQNFQGWAWGSSVVGWMDVHLVVGISTDVAVALTASPSTVGAGENSILTWTPTNAASCTASVSVDPNTTGWSGSKLPTGSSQSVLINQTTAFGINCFGANGSIARATTTVFFSTGSGGGGSNPNPTSTPTTACLFPDGSNIASGRRYCKAAVVPSGETCDCQTFSCDSTGSVSPDPTGFNASSPTTCRINSTVIPF